ncbi:N-acetylmuramoyl-L-alanine amidase [Krasilnikovia sp. MM14-A1259]|uniref:N-acetylmuramoyl-L-alanine amidase n=1 Tax=Krasilnikovia sp. MM14-A1259 TaxID=3373539 RepID=UPI0038291BAD
MPPTRTHSFPLTAAAALVALVVLGSTAPALALPGGPADSRQRAYADAAASSGVPEAVLLAVSYLESRWDVNGGLPSTSAGFGPMHLTDAAFVAPLPTPAAARGTDGRRGDAPDPRSADRLAPPARPDTRPCGTGGGCAARPAPADPPADAAQTLDTAAALTGLDKTTLRSDPAANIRGGAALLATYQRALGAPLTGDVRRWYGAVARYAGAADRDGAAGFADEVYATIRSGAERVTDDGHPVRLTADPVTPDRSWLDRLGLRRPAHPRVLQCPRDVSCEWLPAPYQQLSADPGDYGNHDLSHRPRNQTIHYIVIHDTEESWAGSVRLAQDPTYVAWHYTIRSADGHIAQHLQIKDVGWHAGNWYVNATSIGVEHEGYAAQGAWYTEAMYRASAKLVRYLATRWDIPLDRQHIIGHDNVPGPLPATVAGMHWDPGPYWDWAHYFDLLGAPLRGVGTGRGGLVTIDPYFAGNTPAFTGCSGPATNPCPPHGSSAVILHTAPSETAPLVLDPGLHPNGEPSTMLISDHAARASAGQTYALADVRGDWSAIWYLGQKAWFPNPAAAPTARWSTGLVATPKTGRATIPVYGRAYPEPAAYPAGVPVQPIVALPYTFPAGQRYAVGGIVTGEYYRSTTFDGSSPGDWTVIRGALRYVQIQFGHRVMFVNLADVDVLPAWRRR